MPKSHSSRSFTACWTCRRRNVRCDNVEPHCLQCQRSGLACEGYQFRLVWVDSETGTYSHRQRRSYPCHLTWKDYPSWAEKDIDNLINNPTEQDYWSDLHEVQNPFSTFHQRNSTEIRRDDEEDNLQHLPRPLFRRHEGSLESDNSSVSSVDAEDLVTALIFNPNYAVTPMSATVYTNKDRANTNYNTTESPSAHHRTVQIKSTNLVNFKQSRNVSPAISLSKSLSLMPSGSREENELFFNYISSVPQVMMPIDEMGNPWKSTYPLIAVQNVSSSSARSLYHAILAQSALCRASTKGQERGERDNTTAAKYYGMALRELWESLAKPTEDYSSVLAALLTVTLTEHVFRGISRDWLDHFRGGMGFINQFLAQRPWTLSSDAWTITQNFALSTILAQTTLDCSAVSNDLITKLHDILSDVITEPRFGYTIGGNARLLKSIYQIRVLEEQLIAGGHVRGIQDMDEDIRAQAEEIVDQLQIELNVETEEYMKHQVGDLTALMQSKTPIKLHLHLFNAAVTIYLFHTLYQYPPSAFADYICEVLTDAITLVDMKYKAVSIWPVFVAAAEAYTQQLQALANRFLNHSEMYFAQNRKDVNRVIRVIWADRERIAAERQCDPGEVHVEWREVMKRLDIKILLL